MKTLNEEQRLAFRKHVSEIFPDSRLEMLNSDFSMKIWWKARADKIRTIMQDIDRDQMRSASSLPTLWAKKYQARHI